MIKVGEHITLDIIGTTKEYDPSVYERVIHKIAKAANVTILNISKYKFEPQGFTILALLAESHISFHSYFENSLNDIIILRLELHISSCSRKSVYFALGDISKNDQFDNFDAITLDFFHRGLDLESYEDDGNNILDAYLKEKVHTYDIVDDKRTNTFMNIKLIKHKKKLQSELMSDSLHNHLI